LILNQQRKYAINSSRLGEYASELRRALRLGKREWNVCFVDDRHMERLNSLYRRKDYPTDVLSFPWKATQTPFSRRALGERPRARRSSRSADERAGLEFKLFLGDIVISVDSAKRNARKAGHSTLNEIRWLILHGLLHLLGYDHEADRGEMTRLELALRRRLSIS
jgi:probable rRNA maturation factor